MRRIIDICWRLCKQVPLLPITILAAIPLALLGEWKPWGEAAWDSWISQVGVDGLSAFNPGVGQWIVIALVAYTIVVTVRGMIDDLRHGHVGVDLLAVVAIASTVAVQEYWAAWAVVLMISSGEAIEEFAQSKAESNLTALIDAAPRTAHVVVLPGMRGHVHASGSEHTADVTADGFRAVRVSDSGETDNQDGEKRAFASESPETDTKGASQTYDAAGERFETVPVDQVQLGDVILVLPGETVPVDGELLSGVATLDLSNINGEPVPREVYAGARVMSGAVNGSTTLTMRATQLAQDSQYQKILELVSMLLAACGSSADSTSAAVSSESSSVAESTIGGADGPTDIVISESTDASAGEEANTANLDAAVAAIEAVNPIANPRALDDFSVENELMLTMDNLVAYKGDVTNDQADCGLVFVAQAKDGQVDAVKSELEAYKASLSANDLYAEFADKIALAKDARIVTNGNYVAIVIAGIANPDYAAIDTALETALNF